MSETAVYVIMMVLCVVCGGLLIDLAICAFKRERWVRFGIYVMMAIFEILIMTKHIFTW